MVVELPIDVNANDENWHVTMQHEDVRGESVGTNAAHELPMSRR